MEAIKYTEMSLVNGALQAFLRETGIEIEFIPDLSVPIDMYADGVLRIGGVNTALLNVEIKATINEALLGRLAQFQRNSPENNILITNHVPSYLAKRMRELRIQFLDTAGNAYINRPPLIIYLYGNKPTAPHRKSSGEGLFSKGGIRILFAFLSQPDLEKATYREIADAAGVSLGTVAGVLKDLTERGYLLDLADRGRKLVKKSELVKKWTDAYTTQLYGKRIIGRYSAPRESFWKDMALDPHKALWGGEVAAQKLTHYLRPEVITLYTHKPVDDLVAHLKLRKDENGPVELREQFWNFVDPDNRNIVPPLLVYADLIAMGDPRTIETATIIHDEYFKRYFQ